ncbi:unnamed protein product [Sphagnum balticum]
MLRAKCLFDNGTHIIDCYKKIEKRVADVQEELRDTDNTRICRIVQVENRLYPQVGKPNTSDLVLKIQLDNVVIELQLALKFDEAQNNFAHKLYEIGRSKFFSSMTMLKSINE